MSAARRRKRMEVKIANGKIKATAMTVAAKGATGTIRIGDAMLPVGSWTYTIRTPIDQTAN